jgi:predicted Zn-dependent protease
MCRQCVGVGGLFAGVASTAQTQLEPTDKIFPSSPDGPRFKRPAIETDEGGLWALMDREERRLRRSPFVVRDAALNKYVHELACRLTGSHCPDIRVHIVRTPLFNASMAPNGMMQLWSGLLLRVENEAQLSAVVGHELGHYLERHTLERLRDAKSRAAFAQFVGLFGAAGSLVQLGVLASAFAFSREQEVRADILGVHMMQRAGYEGQQAARVWDNLLGEMKIRGGDDVGKNNPMTATHPPTETRRDDLLRLAGEGAGETGQQAFEQIIGPHRFDWLRDEIKRGQFEESMVLFNRMLTTKPNDPELLYSRAETQRLRAGEQDIQGALNDLQRVTVMDRAPAEAFRSLGLLQRQRSDRTSAVQAFETYLKVAPDAADASLIQNILSELRS